MIVRWKHPYNEETRSKRKHLLLIAHELTVWAEQFTLQIP